MEESLSEYMLRRFCSAYPTVPISLSKVKAYLDTGDVSEEFGDYSDEKEANRNAELLNKVDPFNNYKVKKEA